MEIPRFRTDILRVSVISAMQCKYNTAYKINVERIEIMCLGTVFCDS